MVIISTKPVAAIIQAVSALSMVGAAALCAKADDVVSVAASVIDVTAKRCSARIISFPPEFIELYACCFELERVDVGFAGADAHGLLDRRHEDFSVADLAGARGIGERVDDLLKLLG